MPNEFNGNSTSYADGNWNDANWVNDYLAGKTSKGTAGKRIADFFMNMFSTFESNFTKSLKDVMTTMPYGKNKNALDRFSGAAFGSARAAMPELTAIAQAQGYGSDSGMSRAPGIIAKRSATAQVQAFDAQLSDQASNRFMMLAQLFQSFLDPNSMAISEASRLGDSGGGDAGIYSALGEGFGG